jgi:hypothetical protein
VGFLLTDLKLRERGLFFMAAALAFVGLVERSIPFSAIGVALFVAALLWHSMRARAGSIDVEPVAS